MRLTLIVPCYNEELRLPESEYVDWLAKAASGANARLLFVDDGSRDGTVKVLRRICNSAPAGCASVLELGANQGKAEAVRRGLVHATGEGQASDGDIIGFWDSDLATPLSAVPQLAAVLDRSAHLQMVFAARVALLGREIARSPVRHYLGRVFATLASLTLELGIYDTQCGAKLFRNNRNLRTVIAAPFLTRWVFDCEMIARYAAILAATKPPLPTPAAHPWLPLQSIIAEFPLERWVDVAGSKVKPFDIVRMALGLVRIKLVYFLHEWPSGARKPEAIVRLVGTLGVLAAIVLLALLALGMLMSTLMRINVCP